MNHGIYVSSQQSASAPVAATSGIPFVIGIAPVHTAEKPAAVGTPTKCANMKEFKEKFGYSDDWETYTLCEFAYSQFELYKRGPVVFCSLLDPSTHKSSEAAADQSVVSGNIKLPHEAIASSLVVKASGGSGTAYVKDTDYSVFYSEDALVITVLEDGACKDAMTLSVAYDKITPSGVDADDIAAGIETMELCMASAGCIPDLICAPGFSDQTAVAAAMATKAASVNGLFRAKALVDVSSSSEDSAIEAKAKVADENVIACWLMVKKDDKTYHLSTHLAGVLSRTDAENEGIPYESPSNKELVCDEIVLPSGTPYLKGVSNANVLCENGIVTALSFCGKIVLWGNCTTLYPGETAHEKYFISNARMADYIGNTITTSLWVNVDGPITRRFVDNIVDAAGIWINGLIGAGYVYGASVSAPAAENPPESLAKGIVNIDLAYATPSPAQEIHFNIRYDASYAAAALA